MLFSLIPLLAFGALSAAFPIESLEERAQCNADNVLRLLRATQRLDESIPFCSQFLGLPKITQTAAAVPSLTTTITTTITASAELKKRSDEHSTTTISTPNFIKSTSIPESRLSSACNCLTIPLATVTVTPTSGVATVTATKTVSAGETGEPTVILANPTSAAGWNAEGPAEFDSDDTYYRIELDFPVEIYGFSSNLIFVSVNGLIWLDEQAQGAYQFYFNDADNNGADLPLGGDDLPDVAILPFWTDLFIYGGAAQGVWYEVTGSAGSKTVTIELIAGTYEGGSDSKYHFTASFSENQPNKAVFKYYLIEDSTHGTVAIQHFSASDVVQFSRYGNDVTSGLTLEFDTTTGTVNEA